MRRIGIIGIFTAFLSMSANAMDGNKLCYGLLEENDVRSEAPSPDTQLLLTDEQCDSLKSQELRLPLLQMLQEDEDPMTVGIGVKGGSFLLRFKIPFSF